MRKRDELNFLTTTTPTSVRSDTACEGLSQSSSRTEEQKLTSHIDLDNRSQSTFRLDTDPITDDLGVYHHRNRGGSTSNSSAEENEEQITRALEELSSIPDQAKCLRIEQSSPAPAEPLKAPICLSEIIHYVGASNILNYLHIDEVLQVGQVNRGMKEIVDNYFLHYILPQTEICCFVDHIVEDGYPPSEEYQWLYPVIRRVDKSMRIFPHDRVVFEPDFDNKLKYAYRHGSFKHVELKFHLGDWRRRQKWPLDSRPSVHHTPYTYRANEYWKSREIQYTRIHQFIRFDTFNDSPIHVFYKEVPDTDGEVVRLHAISIPLNYLRQSLCTNIDNGDVEPLKRTITRSNRTFYRKPSRPSIRSFEIVEGSEETKCGDGKVEE